MDKKNRRILLGMSGGIDSTISAILLQEKGYEVEAISFIFYREAKSHFSEVAAICKRLGIPHRTVDVTAFFEEKIVSYFVDEYLAGRTPFPCAKCNKEVKWHLMFLWAAKLGCTYVAMGHYAQTTKEGEDYFIKKGVDPNKDQSFFLWGLTQKQLKHIIFPLGKMQKEDVRQLAEKHGLAVLKEKKESMGACFYTGNYRHFLQQYAQKRIAVGEGHFIDNKGQVLGQHSGYPFYTVGQRRGLGIDLNRAVYVRNINPQTNEITLVPHRQMFVNSFIVENYNVVNDQLFSNEYDTIVKIRYRKQQTLARIQILSDNQIHILLAEPLDAVASGQTAVFYRNECVLGGGFIV